MASAWFYLTLFLAALCPEHLSAQKLPTLKGNLSNNKYAVKVKECYLKDKTNFEACLLTFWQEISPNLKAGIPELNIPSMDPLFMDRLDFNEHASAVQADAKFTNIVVIGAAGIVPKSVKVDKKAKVVTIEVTFPFLNASGDYEIKGTIMLLPIEGKGQFVMNMTGIDATIKANIIQKGTNVKTQDINLNFNIKDIFVKLEGLLGGDEVGVAVNNMLNDNSQQILDDVKPAIAKRIEQVFLNMTADSFVDMPPDAFIA